MQEDKNSGLGKMAVSLDPALDAGGLGEYDARPPGWGEEKPLTPRGTLLPDGVGPPAGRLPHQSGATLFGRGWDRELNKIKD